MNAGESIAVSVAQMPIISGYSVDNAHAGMAFQWGTGMFRIDHIDTNQATLTCMSSEEIKAFHQGDQFHPLDAAWNNPGAQIGEPGRKLLPGKFEDITQGDRAAGDTVPKDQVFPKGELKAPRPPLRVAGRDRFSSTYPILFY